MAIVAVEKESLQLVGYVASGDFPRDMAVSPDETTLVISDFGSDNVEQVDLVDTALAPGSAPRGSRQLSTKTWVYNGIGYCRIQWSDGVERKGAPVRRTWAPPAAVKRLLANRLK